MNTSDVVEMILAWEVGPVTSAVPPPPLSDCTPVQARVFDLEALEVFPVHITGQKPPLKQYAVGTAEHRYWVAVEALGRAAKFWGSVVPAGTKWHETVGDKLKVQLAAGNDFNAAYDREGLLFFKGAVGGSTVFAGESPDILCHEFGHAVLDALQPELWHTASVEVSAFHEAFGDISSILCALQLASVREQVLKETGNRLYRTSRISRFGEQLGWAIRQLQPDRAEADCMRNAVNSFFYRDPAQLPPNGPASILTSEPHLFARVFTASFFEAMSFMLRGAERNNDNPNVPLPDLLEQVSHDAGQLLVDAILLTPIVPTYFSQLGAALLTADAKRFAGKYSSALSEGFKRHGLLAPEGIATVAATAATAAVDVDATPETVSDAPSPNVLPTVPLDLRAYSMGVDTILVHSASQLEAFPVTSAAPNRGAVARPAHDEAAHSFVEDLVRLGRINFENASEQAANHPLNNVTSTKTHEIVVSDEKLVLKRLRFECGMSGD